MKPIGFKKDNYSIIKFLEDARVLVQCNICGHFKNIRYDYFINTNSNFIHGYTCGDTFYEKLEGDHINDMILIKFKRGNKNSAWFEVECNIYHTKVTLLYDDLKNGVGTKHSTCNGRFIMSKNDKSECFKMFLSRWTAMRTRTTNDKSSGYENYGGRGISSDYYKDFEVFYNEQYEKFKEAFKKFKKPSLERIDVNGNYEPSNITWIEFSDQHKNTTKQLRWFEAKDPNQKLYYANNQKDFAKKHHLNQGEISNCLRKKRPRHKDWIFRFLTEEEIIKLLDTNMYII